MTPQEYLIYHKQCCDRMIEIVAKKNHDYAGGNEDAFSNFRMVENCNIASTEQGFLTRMMDKFGRVNSFVKQGVCQVKDETVEDTLLDLANYAILMAGYIKDKKAKATKGIQ